MHLGLMFWIGLKRVLAWIPRAYQLFLSDQQASYAPQVVPVGHCFTKGWLICPRQETPLDSVYMLMLALTFVLVSMPLGYWRIKYMCVCT